MESHFSKSIDLFGPGNSATGGVVGSREQRRWYGDYYQEGIFLVQARFFKDPFLRSNPKP